MLRAEPKMKEIFLKIAERNGEAEIADIEKAINEAALGQRSIIEELLNRDIFNEEEFLKGLADELNISWEENLKPINKRKLREVCSAQLALKHRLLPLSFGDGSELIEEEHPDDAGNALSGDEEPGNGEHKENGSSGATKGKTRLRIATYDPFNFLARQTASQMINSPIEWSMASRTRILQGIQELYGVGADTFEQILAGRDLDMESLDVDRDEANVLDDDDEEASVVKFVNQIIREALEQRATDIHVEPLHDDLRIRYRIDGMLHDIAVPENIRALQSSVIARLKIMSKLDIAERRLPQDGRINLSLDDQQIDVRVATIPTVEGESVSLRLLNQEKFNLDRLGMIDHTRDRVEELLKMSNGIVKSVSEQELTQIGREADQSGLFVCPHTAVALGGVRQALDDSTIKAGESVVVVATAHGLKFTEFKTATAENKVDGASLDGAALPIEVDNRYDDVLKAALDE